MGKHIRIETDEATRIATLTIERADNDRNQLNTELVGELHELLLNLPGNVEALVLASGYERAFSTGADVGQLGQIDALQAESFARHGRAVFAELRRLPIATIAAISGFALGGGLELALHCDFRVCHPGARMALPEINLALIPGWGGSQLLSRLIGPSRALRMILSGEPVNAETALAYALVDEVIEADLLEGARRFARRFTGKSRHAFALAKRTVYDGLAMPLESALEHESAVFGQAWDHPDRVEGITALTERRRPSWGGSAKEQ